MVKESYLKKYEEFLKTIDLDRYKKLKEIKTVEQDLPKALNPLPLIYKYYWEEKKFIDFEKFFQIYWEKNLKDIMRFVKKYFYGCSLQFVEEGFKARLFRTWTSILTQFHFQYLWIDLFPEKLIANAKLDMIGIDSIILFGDKKVGIQIKKISFRREASQRRFTKRQKKEVNILAEIPYLVINEEELIRKLKSKRTKEETKEISRKLLSAFQENFNKLPNGFVIFKNEYLKHIREVIYKELPTGNDFIPYNQFLEV